MQGEQPCMHKRTLYSTCTTACDAHADSRTRHTKKRLEATLPFRTLEMQLKFSLHAGLFTSGSMLPSAKAHAYARPILLLRTTCTCTYARAPHFTHTRAVRHRILAKNDLQCCISEARFWQGVCAVRHAHVYNVQRVHMCMCMSYVTEV